MSPASSIQKMQKLLMNIYKLISSLCESMQYLTHSRFYSFRLSSINSSPFAGAAASHQNVSDRKAWEQHPGICDKCYTLYGNHAAFHQGPDEGRSTRLIACPRLDNFSFNFVSPNSSSARPIYSTYSRRKSRVLSRKIVPELWHRVDRTTSTIIRSTSMAME